MAQRRFCPADPQNVAMTDGPTGNEAAPEPPATPAATPVDSESHTQPIPIVTEAAAPQVDPQPEPPVADAPPITPEPIAEPTPEEPVEPAAAEGTEPEPVVEPAVEPTENTAAEPVAPETVAESAVEPVPATADPAPPAPAAVPLIAAVPASHAARRRRRWPWVTALCILLVLILAAGGSLWYISGLIGSGAAIDRGGRPFPLTVLSAGDSSITYSGSTGGWDDQGLSGVATVEGGYVQTESPSSTGQGDATTTTRSVLKQVLPPAPAGGQAAALDPWFFPQNPAVGLGLEFQNVVYPSPAGPTPAWFIPGTGSTWVIFTHGRGATPREGLRIASIVSQLGYPMLLIKYRDDPKAPVDDGLGNFGAREWPDLQAAVQYALDHGAKKVVLSAASMGGSVTLAFLHNSPLASTVVGAFLDSPATDFGAIVESGAQKMNLPAFATAAGMKVAALRYGFDWEATNYTPLAGTFTTPMLIVQGTADTFVPAKVVERFVAGANPQTVSLEEFPGAGHVMSWNVDRTRYERLLTEFLRRVAPAS